MSDTLLVSTRKGLFTVSRRAGAVGDHRRRFPGRQRHPHADRSAATDVIYAALDHGHFGVKLHRSTGERLGGDRLPPLIRPSPTATRRTTCGAGRSTGARRASGRSRPAAPTSPACSGAERCRAACSARPTTGRAGRWCARSGIIPSASSGWAAAPTCRASIRSASTRAIRGACGSGSRPAASGSPRTAARAGRSAGRACAPNTCRQN